jgi:Helix-turn-helix domain
MLPDDIASIPRSEIPKLLIALSARLLEPEPEPEPAADDKMLTTEEAAKLLRRSAKWISRHRRNLPFARKLSERSWVYSQTGLNRWLSARRK